MKILDSIANFIVWLALRGGMVYLIWLAVFKETETLAECDWAKHILWFFIICSFVLGIARNITASLLDNEDMKWAIGFSSRWAPMSLTILSGFVLGGVLVAGGWVFSAFLWIISEVLSEMAALKVDKALKGEV